VKSFLEYVNHQILYMVDYCMHDEKMLNFWTYIMLSLQIFHKWSSRTLTSLLLQSSVAPFPLEFSNERPWNLLPLIPQPDLAPSTNLHCLTAVIPSHRGWGPISSSFSFLFCSRNLLVEWREVACSLLELLSVLCASHFSAFPDPLHQKGIFLLSCHTSMQSRGDLIATC
jgi:hypothetical protein